MSRIWRILSLDGGGVRGLVPATILASIEQRTGKPIAELFDLIAGTSTGGILALGLTKPNKHGRPQFAAQDLREFYERDAPHIFRNPACWFENLLHPKYRTGGNLARIMRTNFGDSRLKDALADILIPCYDIEHRTPHIFKSRWARRQGQYDFLLSDVARAASATPTMFEPARLPRPGAGGFISLVDGGVFANNPAVLAYAEATSLFSSRGDDYLVVSLGTGESMERMKRKYPTDWGYVRWSIPMIELVSESISEGVHHQMRHLLPHTNYQRYYRFQVDLPDDVYYALDNPSKQNMRGLTTAAERLLADPQTEHDLDTLCDMLVRLSDEKANVACLERMMRSPLRVVSSTVTSSPSVGSLSTISSAPAMVSGGLSTTEHLVTMDTNVVRAEHGQLAISAFSPGLLTKAMKVSVPQEQNSLADRSESITGKSTFSRMTDSSGAELTLLPSINEQLEVVLCHSDSDLDRVADPLAQALNVRGITTVFERIGINEAQPIRRHVSQAAERALICIVILSPALLRNKWASKQFEWLYSRTLCGKNVILPVVHGFAKKDVPALAKHLHWHKKPTKYLEYLLDLAEGTTVGGIEPLADRLANDIRLWLT